MEEIETKYISDNAIRDAGNAVIHWFRWDFSYGAPINPQVEIDLGILQWIFP